MAKDFIKWRIRTSLRLLGIPQRKNRTVTRIKGTRCPAGKRRGAAAAPTGREEVGCGAMEIDAADSSVFEFIGCIPVYARPNPFGVPSRRLTLPALHAQTITFCDVQSNRGIGKGGSDYRG